MDNKAAKRIALMGAPASGAAALAAELSSSPEEIQVEINPASLMSSEADSSHIYDLVLLLGLEATPASSSSAKQAFAIDQGIRQQLHSARVDYQVVYGQGVERLQNALRAISRLLPEAADNLALETKAMRRPWVWACDKCSDPSCEHRLFTDLKASRSAAGTTT